MSNDNTINDADEDVEADISTITNLPSEQFTDSQLSDVFANDYKAIARFCHEMNCWYIWDGKRWEADVSGYIIVLAEECVKERIAHYAETASPKDLERAIACMSTGRFRSIVELAKSKMPIRKSQFNSDTWLLNCTNGVLNLRDGSLMPHQPELFQSYITNVTFDSNADCPKFKAFMNQIMLNRIELVEYLQRAAGYTLTGDTSEQCFFLLMGEGRNGKSTLLEVMRHMWGDYARTVGAKTLMISNTEHIPSDIAQLEGKRYAPCSETSNMQKLNEARIKTLTGGDQVEARLRYANEYNYTPQFKLWVATNSVPTIKGSDDGIWRRIHKIPFELSINPKSVNKNLLEELKQEASGILNWLVEGCLLWKQRGGLYAPDIVRNATEQYRAEMDTVRDFASDCLRKAQGKTITNQQMYALFKEWYHNNVGIGERDMPSHKDMTQRLKQAGYVVKGGKTRKWINVDVIQEVDDLTDSELEALLDKLAPVVSTKSTSSILDEDLPF